MNSAKTTEELEAQYADGLDDFKKENNHCRRKMGWTALSQKIRYINSKFNIVFDDKKRNNERFLEINHNWWFLQNIVSVMSMPALGGGGGCCLLLLILYLEIHRH